MPSGQETELAYSTPPDPHGGNLILKVMYPLTKRLRLFLAPFLNSEYAADIQTHADSKIMCSVSNDKSLKVTTYCEVKVK